MSISSVLLLLLSVFLPCLPSPTNCNHIDHSSQNSTLHAIINICNTTDYPDVCISTLKGVHWKTPPTPTLALLQILHSEKLQVQRDAKTFHGLYKSPNTPLDVKRELIKCKKVYDQFPEAYAEVIREVEGKNFGDADKTCFWRILERFDKCGGENPLYGDRPWDPINLRHKKITNDCMDIIDDRSIDAPWTMMYIP